MEFQEIQCHWCVLATSPFFEKVYFSEMQERIKGRVAIQHEHAPGFLDDVIGYMYGQKVNIGEDNCHQLLSLSHYLMVHQLRDECHTYIKKILTVENCVDVYELMYTLELDMDEIDDFIRGNLPSVLKQPQALEFTKKFILGLVTDERLHYVPKTDLLHFFVCWVNQEPENRIHELEEIMNCVDLSSVPVEVIVRIFESLSIPLQPQARRALESAYDAVPRKEVIVCTEPINGKTYYYFCPLDQTHGPIFVSSAFPQSLGSGRVSGGPKMQWLTKELSSRSFLPFPDEHVQHHLHTFDVTDGASDSKVLRIRVFESHPTRRKSCLIFQRAMLVEKSNAKYLVCATSSRGVFICQRDNCIGQKIFYVTMVQVDLLDSAEEELRSAILNQNRYICLAMTGQATVYDILTNQLVNGSFTTSNFRFCQLNAGVAVFFEGVQREYIQMEMYFKDDNLKLKFKSVSIPNLPGAKFNADFSVQYTVITNRLFGIRSRKISFGSSRFILEPPQRIYGLIENKSTESGHVWEEIDCPKEVIRTILEGKYFHAIAPTDVSICGADCLHCAFIEKRNLKHPRIELQLEGNERPNRCSSLYDYLHVGYDDVFNFDIPSLTDSSSDDLSEIPSDDHIYSRSPPEPTIPKIADMPQKKLRRRKMYYKRLRR